MENDGSQVKATESAASSGNPSIEQEIRLEEAKRATIEAEMKQAQHAEKLRRAESRRNWLGKVSTKALLGVVAAVIVVAFLATAFFIPKISEHPENEVVTESELVNIVNIDKLATIEYIHSGIAEKVDPILWFESISCRIKYKAHVRAEFDMSQIAFTINESKKEITVHLPEIEIGTPELDQNAFGFLPEGRSDDWTEILKLCQEDAAKEISEATIITDMAYDNLKSTVTSLTLPLIGDDYTLVWDCPSDPSAEGTDDEIQ